MEQHHPETAQPVVPAHEREQQQNSSAKYEGLLATLVQCAPPDVPEEQLVLQFASALPPGEQADFLAWWQCKQEEQQAADTQPETASARSELFLQASPSVPPVMVSSSPPNTHQPPSPTDVLPPAPSPMKTPRKVSRRTVLVGLAVGGVVVAGGGMTWWVILRPSPPLVTYGGHTDAVFAVAWSPDGKRIASGSRDKTVQVWSAVDGGNVFTYKGHTGGVNAVAWSSDGSRIASGSGDRTVQVWNAVDGGNVYTYKGHTDAVSAVAWSPDGRYIASGSHDKTVQVRDASTGGNVYTYRGHSKELFVGDKVFGEVYAVAWSPDGRRIASGSWDQTVQVWNAVDGGNVFTYRPNVGPTGGVNAVAWSSDGKRIASGGGVPGDGSVDGTVQVWDAAICFQREVAE